MATYTYRVTLILHGFRKFEYGPNKWHPNILFHDRFGKAHKNRGRSITTTQLSFPDNECHTKFS